MQPGTAGIELGTHAVSVESTDATLAESVVRSAGWLYVQKFAGGAIRIAATIILARMLAPADFGLVALANVLLAFVIIFGSGGVMEFVIADRHRDRNERLNAAFWCNAAIAAAMTALTLAALPFITIFTQTPLLAEVLSLLVVRYLLEQLSAVPEGLIRASLDYRRMTIADIGLAFVSALLSVGLVLTGWGLWSLVIPMVIEYGLKTVWYFIISDWVPSLRPDFRHWKDILRFTLHIRVTMAAGMVAAEGDTLIVGRVLGSSSLGIYSMAYQTSTFIKRGFVTALGSLVLPALTRVGTDLETLARAMRHGVRVIALLTFPLLIVIFVTAGNLVGVLYGPQWGEAVLPLRILTIFAFIHCLSSPATAVYSVLGRPEIGSRLGLAMVPVYLGAVVLGVQWGILGAATAVTLVRIAFGLMQVRAAARITQQPIHSLLRPLVPVLSFVLPIAVITGSVQALLRHALDAGQLISVLGAGIAAAVTALALLRTIHHTLALDLVTITSSVSARLGRVCMRVLNAGCPNAGGSRTNHHPRMA